MRLTMYIVLLIAALVCSLIHVFKQAKADERPGETVLQSFFISFAILGSSCLWWIITVDNEVIQAFGVLFNGLFLGLLTFLSMFIAFYLDDHREVFESSSKQNHDNPRYI